MAEARSRYHESQKHTPIFGEEQGETSITLFPVVKNNDQRSAIQDKADKVEEKFDDSCMMAREKRHQIERDLFNLYKRHFQSISLLFHWEDHGRGYRNTNWEWYNPQYVKLPLSSEYTKLKWQHGKSVRRPKWEIIETELATLKSIFDQCSKPTDLPHRIGDCVQSTIEKYNSQAGSKNFDVLNHYELKARLISVIPSIVDHACALRGRLATPIPVLPSNQRKTIYMTQSLACSILANAFFCTFPKDSPKLPGINFFGLFDGSPGERTSVKVEKLKCILNYFEIVKDKRNDRLISFERRHATMNFDWKDSVEELSKVIVHTKNSIEQAQNMLQVDFANKYIGGGILDNGIVQEEIRFAICPELIVSRLFTEVLNDREVLVITGCEQFSKYSGYHTTFKFEGQSDYRVRHIDSYGRRKIQMVAMDAYRFKSFEEDKQFEQYFVDRELAKCFSAFSQTKKPGKPILPVATGNWGCGAFNGNQELKFLIQWLAASQANHRELNFYTFSDNRQSVSIQQVVSHLKENKVKVGKLYKAILKYEKRPSSASRESLFDFVKMECKKKFFSL